MSTRTEKAEGAADVKTAENELVTTAAAAPARAFRDKEYMSRTLIMPDGRGLDVRQGRVEALDDEQFAFLRAHPDLEPVVV